MSEYIVYHGTFQDINIFDAGYAGMTTANNDHGCFFFSDKFVVAQDYSRASITRRVEDRDREELLSMDINETDVALILEDMDSYVEDNLITLKVGISLNNPYIVDMEYETIDCEEVQHIIGHLKGVEHHEETSFDILENIVCDCENAEEDGCYCEVPEYDGLILKNVTDNIGDASNIYQDEYICFYSYQINSIKKTPDDEQSEES